MAEIYEISLVAVPADPDALAEAVSKAVKSLESEKTNGGIKMEHTEIMDTVDITSHTAAGGWKEYAGGLLDGGEVKLELNFLPANTSQHLLTTAMSARTKKNFKIEFPDTAHTTWTFSAFVTNFEPSAPVDGKLSASATLKITGQPTLSA